MQWTVKNRPTKFSELYGLEGLKKYVKTCYLNNDWPFALLLRGKFGTGKSSVAFLISALMNCQNPTKDGEPCGECLSCKAIFEEKFDRDVILIDGGMAGKSEIIDTINEFIVTGPMRDKKKIIIIEEIQNLSNAAKDSLLKILESKKNKTNNIHFILLSMEAQGLPSGFTSRCASPVTFKAASIKDLMLFLYNFMKKNGYWDNPQIPDEFKKEGLAIIAQTSNGSFRQALQSLEVCIKAEYFTKESIEENLGLIDEVSTIDLLFRIINKDKNVWKVLYEKDPNAFFNLSYSILSDVLIFKQSNYFKFENWDNLKIKYEKLAQHPEFLNLVKVFEDIALRSKPFLRKSDLFIPISNFMLQENVLNETTNKSITNNSQIKIREVKN